MNKVKLRIKYVNTEWHWLTTSEWINIDADNMRPRCNNNINGQVEGWKDRVRFIWTLSSFMM